MRRQALVQGDARADEGDVVVVGRHEGLRAAHRERFITRGSFNLRDGDRVVIAASQDRN